MKRILSPYESTQLARHGAEGVVLGDTTPIEYVTGIAEFCGLPFAVNPSVLIPRVETEGLVEIALECISEKITSTSNLSLIDVGTGSGAVVISLAKHLEYVPLSIHVSATDISEAALEVAQKNAAKLTPLAISFHKSDLLKTISSQFDIIIANLPYIPSEAVKFLDSNVIDHEPIIALDGGTDGFDLIRKLLESASSKLNSKGSVILELDTSHTEHFFVPYEKDFSITFYKDCFDRHRFARLDLKN